MSLRRSKSRGGRDFFKCEGDGRVEGADVVVFFFFLVHGSVH